MNDTNENKKNLEAGMVLQKYVLLGIIDVFRRMIVEMDEFDRLAFRGYYNAADGRFEEEFFSKDHRRRIMELVDYVVQEDNSTSPTTTRLHSVPREKGKAFGMVVFGLLVSETDTGYIFQKVQAYFEEEFPNAKAEIFQQRVKLYRDRLRGRHPHFLKALLATAEEEFSKAYQEMPLFWNVAAKEILPKNEFVSALFAVLNQAVHENNTK